MQDLSKSCSKTTVEGSSENGKKARDYDNNKQEIDHDGRLDCAAIVRYNNQENGHKDYYSYLGNDDKQDYNDLKVGGRQGYETILKKGIVDRTSSASKLPNIKVPFPPIINLKELISRPRKGKTKVPSKPPNAFMIYRMQYVKELHARNHRLPMRSISPSVANSWREEPDSVVNHYEQLARDAKHHLNTRFLYV
ncbi:11259_t:CDS:2 [Entrophospora sp. SA101]|nr:11259_t:CDS:2 [Entrophospora sp. SA101]